MLVKVAVQDGKGCEKVLKIEVGPEEIQKEYGEFYASILSKARVPGFRPGKAPRNVLELHYGQEAREKVLKHLLSEAYRQALQEKSLNPLGYPEIENLHFDDKKLSFDAKIEARPKIKLNKVTGLSAKKDKVQLKPEEVRETLGRVQESFAQFKVVEDRPSQMGDFLIADYVCIVEGKEIEKRADDWFELKEDEFFKGLSPQLAGAKTGEQKEISVIFPEKIGRKELAGKPAVFKVTVKEIKTKFLPPLDDELAKMAGEFKTFQELKDKIHADLAASQEHEVETRYERALLDELVKQNKMELPQGLVKRRLERLVENALHQGHNHDPKHPHSHDGDEERKEKLRVELAEEARRQVHLAFLLDEIAVKENFTATEEDLKEKYKQISEDVRQPVEAVEKYYAENEEAKASLLDQIHNEKAIEYIKQHAKES